jgi:hypothetical protein
MSDTSNVASKPKSARPKRCCVILEAGNATNIEGVIQAHMPDLGQLSIIEVLWNKESNGNVLIGFISRNQCYETQWRRLIENMFGIPLPKIDTKETDRQITFLRSQSNTCVSINELMCF